MFIVTCPGCKKEDTKMKHLCNSPYGLQGAYISGTERFVCECGYEIYRDEGIKLGLKFILEDWQ